MSTPNDNNLQDDAGNIVNDPKYDFQNGRIINRASGELIPADEPAFVLRARDAYAEEAISYYASIVPNTDHRAAVVERVVDFANFAASHPERMKEPDTEYPFPSSGVKKPAASPNSQSAIDELEALRKACRNILPYLEWTIGPESPSHHPTMPSAVAAFRAQFLKSE